MPFTKGDPNCNRKGRPRKKKSLGEYLEKWGKKRFIADPRTGKMMITMDLFAEGLWRLAINELFKDGGDIAAARLILDRIDGKAVETKKVGGAEDLLPILWQYMDPEEDDNSNGMEDAEFEDVEDPGDTEAVVPEDPGDAGD